MFRPLRTATTLALFGALLATSGCSSLAEDRADAAVPGISATPSSPSEGEGAADGFTAEAPSDPDTVEEAPGKASVAIDSAPLPDTALAVLATLPVKGRAPKTGYDREVQFGDGWLDVDRNGCDTRNDVLARDLTGISRSGPCKVLTGSLVSPYTGAAIDFVRGPGTSSEVQIDHVVALADAWQKGAQQLTQAQRVSFANDPLNLLAVDGRSNAQKGAGDAATWLPAQKSFRCEYVARQVSVKANYGLWVTQAEHDAIAAILSGCSGQPAIRSSFAPVVVVPVAPPTPTPEVAPAPAPAPYYKNCTAAREAGAAPVTAGQPGYGRHLDRDGDGVGCE
ncbi:excalibur calcium-binding domain-containing protein [Salinibacterium sp. SYSU T00001]|uniref:GmrSD restriction endonuclease domain-containing protein n=1 Tax=Homoserinimonas sedimenticola TaxID=2986805 RepID=UPI0022367932|nr:DUF1524 domain-containing protein [Salinibacterium sedimenticola]MCW4385703.1 excalibur calcium-binding domain-containing protein [Salinibacterium sedimenticola]